MFPFSAASKVLGRGYLMNVGRSAENVVNLDKYIFFKKSIDMTID